MTTAGAAEQFSLRLGGPTALSGAPLATLQSAQGAPSPPLLPTHVAQGEHRQSEEKHQNQLLSF